jgi:hypothetical protein
LRACHCFCFALYSLQTRGEDEKRKGDERNKTREEETGGEGAPHFVQDNPSHISLISTEKSMEEFEREWALRHIEVADAWKGCCAAFLSRSCGHSIFTCLVFFLTLFPAFS